MVPKNARAGRSHVRRVSRRDVLRQGRSRPLPSGSPDAHRTRPLEGSGEHRGRDRGSVVPGGGFEHGGAGPGGDPNRASDPRLAEALPDLPRRPLLVPQLEVSVAGRVRAHRRAGGTVAGIRYSRTSAIEATTDSRDSWPSSTVAWMGPSGSPRRPSTHRSRRTRWGASCSRCSTSRPSNF